MEKIVHDERQDERTYCILSRPCKTRLCYLETRKVRTESDPVALDLQSDYISFGFYRDINFVQEDFQLEVIYKVRVIVLIVVVS